MKKYFDRLYGSSIEEFSNKMDKNLKNRKKMFIVTANPETFSYGEKDKEINKLLLDKNTTLVPDGIAIVTVAKMHKYKIKERIAGIDLANRLLEICNNHKYKLALLGAKEEVIVALKAKIENDYPNIKIVKTENGYTKDKDKFFDDLVRLKPDVCLVALGIPAQEKLIYKHLDKFDKGIFIGVGGSFDVMSGMKKRAPIIFQKLNLEWLYRITKEPKRLKRFYNSNIKFIFKTIKLK